VRCWLVIVDAYVKGMSTRKVDDLVRALCIDGISKPEVSRIRKVLDEDVKTFLARPIQGEHPYVWLDATFHKIRDGGRVVQVATVVAEAKSDPIEALPIARITLRELDLPQIRPDVSIPACSGSTVPHRMNRGGNRQLNRALHVVAFGQARSHPRLSPTSSASEAKASRAQKRSAA
jgi:Transposase, Mutator family